MKLTESLLNNHHTLQFKLYLSLPFKRVHLETLTLFMHQDLKLCKSHCTWASIIGPENFYSEKSFLSIVLSWNLESVEAFLVIGCDTSCKFYLSVLNKTKHQPGTRWAELGGSYQTCSSWSLSHRSWTCPQRAACRAGRKWWWRGRAAATGRQWTSWSWAERPPGYWEMPSDWRGKDVG